MKIVVTGATGLIGRPLCSVLSDDGHNVIGLSRAPERAGEIAAEMMKWEPQAGPPPEAAIKDAGAIIHLAGEPIAARRWSEEQKRRIRDSRVITTKNLVSAIASSESKPEVLVSGSAVGFYGDRGDEMLDESAGPGSDFLSDVCVEWEREAERATDLSVRVVTVRTGVVLDTKGGALNKMLPAFKLGVAGPLGSGRQWFPWIHIADIVGLFRHAVNTTTLRGPINGAAPEPVTNNQFTKQLASTLHRLAILPVPGFALRLLMGEMAEILLASQRVIPRVALDTGYAFRYPHLEKALEDLLA